MLYSRLCSAYSKEADKGQEAVYADHLEGWDDAVLQASESGIFGKLHRFPSIGQVVRFIDGRAVGSRPGGDGPDPRVVETAARIVAEEPGSEWFMRCLAGGRACPGGVCADCEFGEVE